MIVCESELGSDSLLSTGDAEDAALLLACAADAADETFGCSEATVMAVGRSSLRSRMIGRGRLINTSQKQQNRSQVAHGGMLRGFCTM